MATAYFETTSPFGNLTGWELQTANTSDTHTRAQALGADGDECAKKLHDAKTSVTATYTLKTKTSCNIPKFGEILNGYHIDSVSIAFTNTGFVQMTVTGHKHGSTAHQACRTYTGSLTTIASEFGCPSLPTGMKTPTAAGVRSVTYNLTGNHDDQLGAAGEWLCGDNYDGVETVDIELCDSTTIVAETGWDVVTGGKNVGNTIATATSATLEHHIAHNTAAAA